MKRRQLMISSARVALASAAGLSFFPAQAQAGYKVSSEQLQSAIASRFPKRYAANGLLDLTLQAPQLRLMAAQNRLGAKLAVQAAGPVLQRAYPGLFDLDFALRYEPADLTIRASALRVNTLQFDGLPPQASILLSGYGPQLAAQALQDAVLHTLTPKDLALPDTMGLQPGEITVTANGLVVSFVRKQATQPG